MDKGAHYHRCDLQVHSPRDLQWVGSVPTSDEERAIYAAKLIEECRKKGLDAIAITDHHDMAFISYARKAALLETDEHGLEISAEKRLVVFPGIELTLAVPCQAILILDADFEDNRFGAVLTALAINQADPRASKTAQTVRLENIQSLKTLKEKLDEHDWLRERYIVFPNVTGEGQFSLLRSGMAAKYKEMPFVGGYVDGEIADLKAGPVNILAGKDKGWGNKRIALIQTSDNRREDHADLGRSTSWVKWANPTAEALRQACLAQESRISQIEPTLPAAVISSISVSNSSFLGPIELAFNPQYNALIGGRGTGKSTILEYLRWALCDQPPLVEGQDAPNYQARRMRLIDNTLKPLGSTVDVTFLVNNVEHLVRRDSTNGSIMIRIGSDELRSCTEDEVRAILPIQAYSQKQLSDVSVRTDELTRFVRAPIRGNLALLERTISERADRVRQNYESRRRQRTIESELARRELEIRSLQEQTDAIRNSLSGLSDDDRTLLGKGTLYNAANEHMERWLASIRSLASEAESHADRLAREISENPMPAGMPEADIVGRAHADFAATLQSASDEFRTVASRVLNSIETASKTDTVWSIWRRKLAEFRQSYNDAVARSSAHAERMDQLRSLEETLSAHKKEATRLSSELKVLLTTGEAYEAARKLWYDAIADRDRLLQEQCNKLTADSVGGIRAQIKRFADPTEFVDRLRETLSGSNVRRERIESIGSAIITAEKPGDRWAQIIGELEVLATFDPEAEGAQRRPETPILATMGLTATDLDRISRKLNSSEWLSLSLTEIKSEVVFEYRSREHEYIAFKNASPGQQATALLKTLLNQSGSPLLIDQPEEDLDNPLMQEIVAQIWDAKKNRQLVFVSHNANLVVNGDAELVAWCDYRKAGDQSGGKIAGEGAIDIPDAREAIKRIMEGGEAAFRLRREKYGF